MSADGWEEQAELIEAVSEVAGLEGKSCRAHQITRRRSLASPHRALSERRIAPNGIVPDSAKASGNYGKVGTGFTVVAWGPLSPSSTLKATSVPSSRSSNVKPCSAFWWK